MLVEFPLMIHLKRQCSFVVKIIASKRLSPAIIVESVDEWNEWYLAEGIDCGGSDVMEGSRNSSLQAFVEAEQWYRGRYKRPYTSLRLLLSTHFVNLTYLLAYLSFNTTTGFSVRPTSRTLFVSPLHFRLIVRKFRPSFTPSLSLSI